MPKPLLICSTKAAPHLALISHISGSPLHIDKCGKPTTEFEHIAATYFTEDLDMPDPVTGQFSNHHSDLYADYIFTKAKTQVNQINYSELMQDAAVARIAERFKIVQIIPDPASHHMIILRRFFLLYGLAHKNYLFLDRGLPKHRHLDLDYRLDKYMFLNGWTEHKDKPGFLRWLLDDVDNPMRASLREEHDIKRSRAYPSFTYSGIFSGDAPEYEALCSEIDKVPDRKSWIAMLDRLKLPSKFYKFGHYWDIENI